MNHTGDDAAPCFAFSGFVEAEPYKFQIYLVDSDGSNPRRVSVGWEADESTPAWSRDGSYLAYGAASATDHGETSAIYCSEDGSPPVNLTVGTRGRGPRWMPDGKHILYFSDDGPDHWDIVDVAGQGRHRLFGDHLFGDVSCSPDGTHYAVTALGENIYGFSIVTAAGDMVQAYASSHRYVTDLIWSPTGREIAFIAADDEEGTRSGLYVLARATGEAHRVGSMAFEGTFEWSSDGERLAFVGQGRDSDVVYIVDRDGSDAHPLLDLNRGDPSGEIRSASPSWSSDGRHLAVSTFVDDAFTIDVYSVEGQLTRQLTWDSPAFTLLYDVAWQP